MYVNCLFLPQIIIMWSNRPTQLSKLKTSEVKQVIQDFRPRCCKNKDLLKGENQVTSNRGLTGLEGQYAIIKLKG